MRFTTPNSGSKQQTGFTLVEVLIIAPLALLVISGFIALMVTLTGDVLASSARTTLIEKTDFALERFEQDARFAKEFRATSFTPPSPQGRNDNSTPFNVEQNKPDSGGHGTVRILRSYATTKNPLDPTKSLIYTTTGPGNCADDTRVQNDPYEYDIIYYVKQSSGTAAENNIRYSMWRRIIFNPSQVPCSVAGQTIWQKRTCTPGTTTGPCQAEDEKIIDNLVEGGFGGYYAAQPDQTAFIGRPDCIRPCPHGYNTENPPGSTSAPHTHTSGDERNILFPTSADGANANASYFFLSSKITVAGRDTEYSAGVFARLLNTASSNAPSSTPAPPLTLSEAWSDGVTLGIAWNWPSGANASSNYRVAAVCPGGHTTTFTKSSPPSGVSASGDHIFLFENANTATFSCSLQDATTTISYETNGNWSQSMIVLPSQWVEY